jgi:O-antigen/teichoic acid export membrane protein
MHYHLVPSREDVHSTLNMTWRLGRATVVTLLTQVAQALLALVSIPILLANIGDLRFGILAFFWTLLAYFGVSDLGLGYVTTRLISEALGAKHDERVPEIYWTTVWLLVGLSFILTAIVFLCTPWFVRTVLNVSPLYESETERGLYIVAVCLPLAILTNACRGLLEAYRAFFLRNIVFFASSATITLGPLITIYFSHRIDVIAATLLLGRVTVLALGIAFTIVTAPAIYTRRRPSSSAAVAAVKLGGWVTVSNVIGPLLQYGDRFIIGSFVSIPAVSYYFVAYEAAQRVMLATTSMTTVLMPTFAGTAKRDHHLAVALLNISAKIALGVTFSTALVAATFAGPLLSLWLGPTVAAHATGPLRVILAGMLFKSLAIVYLSFLLGNGRPDLPAKLDLSTLVYYTPLMLMFIYNFGLIGAASAYVIRIVVTCVALGAQVGSLAEDGDTGYRRCTVFAALGAFVILSTGAPAPEGITASAAASAGFIWLLATWRWLLEPTQRTLLRQRASDAYYRTRRTKG